MVLHIHDDADTSSNLTFELDHPTMTSHNDRRQPFVPFPGTVEDWNAAHSSPGNPSEFADRLKIQWHAFAAPGSAMPSTIPADFWKISDAFDRTHGVQTNYLIRFAVNTTDKVSLVPFQVYVQQEVQEVQLTLYSNIEALSGTYRFVIK